MKGMYCRRSSLARLATWINKKRSRESTQISVSFSPNILRLNLTVFVSDALLLVTKGMIWLIWVRGFSSDVTVEMDECHLPANLTLTSKIMKMRWTSILRTILANSVTAASRIKMISSWSCAIHAKIGSTVTTLSLNTRRMTPRITC